MPTSSYLVYYVYTQYTVEITASHYSQKHFKIVNKNCYELGLLPRERVQIVLRLHYLRMDIIDQCTSRQG